MKKAVKFFLALILVFIILRMAVADINDGEGPETGSAIESHQKSSLKRIKI